MQGDIVTAAKWLGASLLLSSGILIGGLRWTRSGESSRPVESVAPASRSPVVAPEILNESSQVFKADAAVGQASIEELIRPIPVPRPVPVHETAGCAGRVPILDPIPGNPTTGICPDPPAEDEIWAKVPRSKTTEPVFYQTRREKVQFLIEKIGEKADPCKLYPLAGPCQLIHCHYKCTVYFDELFWSDYPVPFNHVDHRVEVVYLDKDYLRRSVVPATPQTTP